MPGSTITFDRARRQRSVAVVLAALVLAASGVVAGAKPPVAAAAEPILPFGFTDEVVLSGLSFPTAVEFAPNGQIFVAEKAGRIKVFDSLDDTTPILVADLRTNVHNVGDKGLLDLAVDPDYPESPYVYALYSYDAMIGGTAPLWGTADTNGDPCRSPPNGPGGDGCRSSGRLTRLELDSGAVMDHETELINDWCVQFDAHSIGTVTFGPDGYLYAGAGDGASYAIYDVDHGQYGGTSISPSTGQPYTPVNPCGDPPGGVGTALSPPTAQGGSLRAQSIRRPSGQPTVLDGTIIRIDPETGLAAPDNAAFGSGRDENEKRVIAYGLRNPYRFDFRPGSAELWVGDVGSFEWEEVNRIVDPTGPVKNFGWPCYEGPPDAPADAPTLESARNGAWDGLDVATCETLYLDGADGVEMPYYAYRHGKGLFAGDPCTFSGGVVSGLVFENGDFYPARYRDALYLTDYARGCIWVMRAGSNGLPDPGRLEVFVQNAAGPVDLKFGPDGNLYYVEFIDANLAGHIHRVTYDGLNQRPVIEATATPPSGEAPLDVDFDASASFDPEGDPITFAWDLDGDGEFDDGSESTASRTYAEGTHTPRVRVSDDQGNAATHAFEINAGRMPVPVIDSPPEGTTWIVGQDLAYSGHATDPDEGNLPASSLSWQWIMHHCTGSGPNDCHQHVELETAGNPSTPFRAPEHEFPSYLELRLTATDGQGLAASTSREFHPQSVDVTFATDPAGLELHGAGETQAAPFTRTFIVGTQIAVDAPESQWFDGTTYLFDGWSDGGPRTHTINAPGTNQTYTAGYAASLTTDAPNRCAGATTDAAQDTWLGDTISRKRDVDWYRFTVSSKRHVRVLLGNLGGNYRIDLFKKCGSRKAGSIRPGMEFEEIYRLVNSGTFRVRVKRQAGPVAPSVNYGLKFMQLDEEVQILSSKAWTSGATGELNIVAEVLNNTDLKRRLIQVRATIYNSADAVIATHEDWAWVSVVPGRQRSQLRMAMPRPAGYHHYRVEVSYSQPTAEELVRLTTTASSNGSDAGGIWFRGSLVNENAFTTKWTTAMTVLYDKWGDVHHADARRTSPYELAPGTTATFDVPFTEHHAGWNRATTVIQGTRAPGE